MELKEAIKYFENQNVCFKHILDMGSVFSRLEETQWNDAVAKFHNEAGRLDYLPDNDFGALVLESEARRSSSPEINRFLLHHALMRAEWCVQASTAGGELIARGLHVDRISNKLSKCT